ncbi:MAG: hypothetical protein IPM82_11930 [Saprospiraceae bacterium]|nr:hypothetical protein [Saprospiraceae bacterium]
MNNAKTKLWPYKPSSSILLALVLMAVLITAFILLGKVLNWPAKDSDVTVLIGVLLFSILPVVLVLIDAIMERGGSFEIEGFKINLPETTTNSALGFAVPDNIGAPGQPITDSSTTQILDALSKATT